MYAISQCIFDNVGRGSIFAPEPDPTRIRSDQRPDPTRFADGPDPCPALHIYALSLKIREYFCRKLTI